MNAHSSSRRATSPGLALWLCLLALFALVVVWIVWDDDPGAVTPGQEELAGHAAESADPESFEGRASRSISQTERIPGGADEDRSEASGTEPSKLLGRVVDDRDGSPIEGAEIRLTYRADDDFTPVSGDWFPETEEIASTRTDAGGLFQLSGEVGRVYRLEARTPGFGPEVVPARRVGSDTEIRLKQSASLEGVVRIGEEPVAFCPVLVSVIAQPIRLAEGRTDASGRFRFEGLPATHVYVEAVPKGRPGGGEGASLTAGQEKRVEITLPVGETLRGRVVDAETRAPIPGALVSPSGDYKFFISADQDGRFELDGMDGDPVVVHVSEGRYASTAVNWTGRLDEECVVELSQGANIIGRVDNGLGGVPPGLEIVGAASFSTSPGYASTAWSVGEIDKDGSFVLPNLRTDLVYGVVVRAPRYGRLRYVLPGNLEPGQTFDMGQLSLSPPAEVRGRVVDETGRPIAGVEVRLWGGNPDMQRFRGDEAGQAYRGGLNSREARSDAQGLFTIGELCGGHYTLTVRSQRHAEPEERTIEITSGLSAPLIEIALQSLPSIRGLVRFQDGSTFRRSEHGDLMLSAKCLSNNDWQIAYVADGGAFEILGVTGDEYILTSMGSPDGWALPPQPKVEAGADQVVLMFEKSSVLAGQVVGPDGKGMQARLLVFYDDFPELGASPQSTEPDGRFRLDVPSSYKGMVIAVHVADGENKVRIEGVKAGTRDLRLQLK